MSCRFKLGIASWKHPNRKRIAYALEDKEGKLILVCPKEETLYHLVLAPLRYTLNHIYTDDSSD